VTSPTGAHFHGPVSYVGLTSEQNAPIQVGTPGSLASPFKGSTTITDAQAKDLMDGRWCLRGRLWGHDKRLSRPERAKCATARLTIVIARLRIVFTRSARILHQSRPVVILADTRPGAPEIMFGIEHMGLPVGQSAESLGEVGKFALGYARAAPVGMLLAGLFDKAVLP
jgi:hypothetical protein